MPAWQRLPGIRRPVRDIGAVGDAGLVVVTNPNDPDGRIVGRDELLALAGCSRAADCWSSTKR